MSLTRPVLWESMWCGVSYMFSSKRLPRVWWRVHYYFTVSWLWISFQWVLWSTHTTHAWQKIINGSQMTICWRVDDLFMAMLTLLRSPKFFIGWLVVTTLLIKTSTSRVDFVMTTLEWPWIFPQAGLSDLTWFYEFKEPFEPLIEACTSFYVGIMAQKATQLGRL